MARALGHFENEAEIGVPLAERPYHCFGVIRTAVINDDNLKRFRRGCLRLERLQRQAQQRRTIVCADDDGDYHDSLMERSVIPFVGHHPVPVDTRVVPAWRLM